MVNTEPHIRRGHPIIFGLLLFFGLIEGIITAWLVSKYNSNNSYPSDSARDRLRFLLFTSWWTVVFCALYLGAFLANTLSFITSIASHGAWLALTWIFWLAGAASITAAYGGGVDCGSSDLVYCNQNMAALAFAWIEWILITVAFVIVIVIGAAALRRGDRLSGGLA